MGFLFVKALESSLLDAIGKGEIGPNDVNPIKEAAKEADVDHDGKLTAEEYAKYKETTTLSKDQENFFNKLFQSEGGPPVVLKLKGE